MATRKDPLLKTETFAYDSAGNLKTLTDRKSQVTSYTYDALGRRTGATYADQSTTAYTYDAGDRLTQMQDSQSGTITFSYDGLDRLTQETGPRGTVGYTYDAAGGRTNMTVAGQPSVTLPLRQCRPPDAGHAGRAGGGAGPRRRQLTGLTYRQGANVLGTLTYTYDGARNRQSVGGTWTRTGLSQAATATYRQASGGVKGVRAENGAQFRPKQGGGYSITPNGRVIHVDP